MRTRSSRSFFESRVSSSGSSTFWKAVSTGSRLNDWKTKPDVLRAPLRELRRRHRAHLRAADPDGAAGRLVQPGDQVEQGGLARARRTHQRGEGPLLDVHRQPVEHVDPLGVAAEALVYVPDLDQCHGSPVRRGSFARFDSHPVRSDRPPRPSPAARRPRARGSPRGSRRSPAPLPPRASASRPSRTSQTTVLPPDSRTARGGNAESGRDRARGGRRTGRRSLPPAPPSRKSTRAPISGKIRGSRSRMLTFTCTVARCRSAVGTTCRTSPRNDVSG